MMKVRTLRTLALGCTLLSLLACTSAPSPRTIDGQAVADRLNARFLNLVDDCEGQPAYLCSGVAARVLDPFVVDLQPLDPTPTQIARDGVSFSFLRKDLNIRTLHQGGWAGYVVDMQNKAGFVPLRARCMFPINAATNTRPDSCGRSEQDQTPTLKSRPCAEQGIHTPQDWGRYYNELLDTAYSCSFDTSPGGFLLSMASRRFIPEDSFHHGRLNELVIGAWKQEEVRQLPVEAMFYVPVDFIPISRVQTHQCRIFFATGRRIPLLRLDIEHEGGTVFTFDQAEQIDFDAATPACVYASK